MLHGMYGDNTAQAAIVIKQHLNFAQCQLSNRVAQGDTLQNKQRRVHHQIEPTT